MILQWIIENTNEWIIPYPNPTLPQLSRPARPERCQACDFEIGITSKDSIPVADCETRIFTIPVSTTYLIPWIVTEDSAILVDRMTLRVLGGVGVNTTSCWSGGKAAYNG